MESIGTRRGRLKISRRSWLLAGLAIPLFRARAADPLKVTYDGDNLHVAAPDLAFPDRQAAGASERRRRGGLPGAD